MAALRVAQLDLLRRRAEITESVTVVRGRQVWGTPKGHERRSVPIPRFLVDELAAHVAGKSRDGLVFCGAKGGVAVPGVPAVGVHRGGRPRRRRGHAPARASAHGRVAGYRGRRT
jgi:hypothetical protein